MTDTDMYKNVSAPMIDSSSVNDLRGEVNQQALISVVCVLM